MTASPTSRTLRECRARGWLADVTERWIAIPNHPAGGKRKDLFGFVDVLAVGVAERNHWCSILQQYVPETKEHFIAIQATSGSNGAARVIKIKTECREAAEAWIAAGGIIEVWAWKKYAKAVERKYWRPNITRVEL